MLEVTKEQVGQVLVVRLSGAIIETTDFGQLIGPPASEMHIICKDVRRINSLGLRSWIRYFRDAHAKGSVVTLKECSTTIVEQLSYIFDFAAGCTVESIYLPFVCGNCKSELFGLYQTEALRKQNLSVPGQKCPKCGAMAAFDDNPDDYLAFLR